MGLALDEKTITLLKRLSNVAPQGLISASANFSEGRMEEQGELDHYIGAATTAECPEHLSMLEVLNHDVGRVRSGRSFSRNASIGMGADLFRMVPVFGV